MNNYLPGGQVLGAVVSVLPATGAYALLSQFQLQNLTESVLVFAGLWTVSYFATNTIMRFVKR